AGITGPEVEDAKSRKAAPDKSEEVRASVNGAYKALGRLGLSFRGAASFLALGPVFIAVLPAMTHGTL
ncbi:MAG: hypothetical protein WCI38_10250, partial [Chthoniobacterales bacterium]